MPNTRKNSNEMMNTFKISGMLIISDCTPSLSPSFRLITLSGRSTLSSRNAFNAFVYELLTARDTTENTTIMKSITFQQLRK